MKPLKPKIIPANVAAIWGAFLYEGILVCSQDSQRETAVLKQWHQGCVELMAAACAFLPEVWRQIEPRWYEAQFPGVFEYEVIAPLGVIIGDYILLHHGSLPPREVVREFVEELIGDFFANKPVGLAHNREDASQPVVLH